MGLRLFDTCGVAALQPLLLLQQRCGYYHDRQREGVLRGDREHPNNLAAATSALTACIVNAIGASVRIRMAPVDWQGCHRRRASEAGGHRDRRIAPTY